MTIWGDDNINEWFRGEVCENCDGSGVVEISETECEFCFGTGYEERDSAEVFGTQHNGNAPVFGTGDCRFESYRSSQNRVQMW